MTREFNAKQVKDDLVVWIQDWFKNNGEGCNAIIGLSGGKDSTIMAALCAEALGKEHVIGVAMPDNGQSINDADEIAKYLGIHYILAPIGPMCDGIRNISIVVDGEPRNDMWSNQAEQNVPPRARMAMLYAIAQTYNGRPTCNCNLSEDYVGYATQFGDNAGAVAPFRFLTVQEVLAIGEELNLPDKWVHKTPDDGLPHSCSDEEKFGFTYKELDKYIRTGEYDKPAVKEKIDRMHERAKFKLDSINLPAYNPGLQIYQFGHKSFVD